MVGQGCAIQTIFRSKWAERGAYEAMEPATFLESCMQSLLHPFMGRSGKSAAVQAAER
jgi:hypothetical protein